jgi:hypothetical protein
MSMLMRDREGHQMTRQVAHEITLTAYSIDKENDTLLIHDLIETSYHNASFFMRGFYRNRDVIYVSAASPEMTRLNKWGVKREIKR